MVYIDTVELDYYRKRLEKMHKSDFPLAVRGALNDVAFDVKKNTMPDVFGDRFTVRREKFLSSHSQVVKCSNTFDIKRMSSEAGVTDRDVAGKQLKQIEYGGVIGERMVPTKDTRIGNSLSNRQDKAFFYKKFQNKKSGKVIDVIKGNNVFKTKSGNIVLVKRSPLIIRKGVVISGKTKLLYHKRNVSLKSRPFVQPSSEMSSEKIGVFFIKRAHERLSK